jgi:hypothetical protein
MEIDARYSPRLINIREPPLNTYHQQAYRNIHGSRMTTQQSTPSDEFAQVVWASHILSYLDPYTATKTEKTGNLDAHQISVSSDNDREDSDSDDEDLEEDLDLDTASLIMEPLTALDEPIREKFLDSVSELLARGKGGSLVTAATLRELEDSVEIDVARNDGLNEKDEDYMFSTSKFLSLQGEEGMRSMLAKTTQR